MELRTVVRIDPSPYKITYSDPVMLVGSCFASSIGTQMKSGKMPVLINPTGTIYNPLSVLNTLELVMSGREYSMNDIQNQDGIWFSFEHYTAFSSRDPHELLDKINLNTAEASRFLEKAAFLFVTFGTARVYVNKNSGKTVSNCHRVAASEFTNRLLGYEEIAILWENLLDRLQERFPSLKIIFTISPVRHWKDGAHGNQVSKATLLLAIERLLSHRSKPLYFPAYEILLDDLRDYRFYDSDMLHPSASAVEYIWEAFSGSFLEESARNNWNEIYRITKARRHIIKGNQESGKLRFAEQMLAQISSIESKYPFVDMTAEKAYFRNLL